MSNNDPALGAVSNQFAKCDLVHVTAALDRQRMVREQLGDVREGEGGWPARRFARLKLQSVQRLDIDHQDQ
jgi:hypothetical protein